MPPKMRSPRAADPRASGNVLSFGKLDVPEDNRSAPRLQYLAERVHRLGPRPLGELIAEIIRASSPELAAFIIARLERYAALDQNLVRLLGGHRWPPRLIAIEGGHG